MSNIIIFIPPLIALIALIASFFSFKKAGEIEDRLIVLLNEEFNEAGITVDKLKIVLNGNALSIKGRMRIDEKAEDKEIAKQVEESIYLALSRLGRDEFNLISDSSERSSIRGHSSYKDELLYKTIDKMESASAA